jgi:hypothetical protein
MLGKLTAATKDLGYQNFNAKNRIAMPKTVDLQCQKQNWNAAYFFFPSKHF